MRNVEFNVPEAVMTDFVKEIEKRELEGIITGMTEDDEVIIRVEFERDETSEVDELEEALNDLVENLEEEEEE